MPTKERNPWEANNETKVVFFSRTVCAKLHFYVIFRAICHFLGTTSSLSFSNRERKKDHNDLYIIALTMHGGWTLQAYESDLIMDILFLPKVGKFGGTFSLLQQGFYCFSKSVQLKAFIFKVQNSSVICNDLYVTHTFLVTQMPRLLRRRQTHKTSIRFPHQKVEKLRPREVKWTCLHLCRPSVLTD